MDIPTHGELLAAIDAFRARHGNMAESRLGREATGEPGLVDRIRAGGNVTLNTLNRLAAFMAEQDVKVMPQPPSASATKAGEIISPEREAPPAHPFCATSSATSGPGEDMPSRPRSSTGPTPVADRAEWPVEAERPAA
jgi:hypothetical protein